jgi:hypothetical protein
MTDESICCPHVQCQWGFFIELVSILENQHFCLCPPDLAASSRTTSLDPEQRVCKFKGKVRVPTLLWLHGWRGQSLEFLNILRCLEISNEMCTIKQSIDGVRLHNTDLCLVKCTEFLCVVFLWNCEEGCQEFV